MSNTGYDFTKYSYDDLVDMLTTLVKDTNGWGDAYMSSTGQTIIQLIAASVDQLHYMLERRGQETYLPTAKLATSIRTIASSLSYRPDRATAATGTSSLQIVDGNGLPEQPVGNVVIAKDTKVTYDGVDFVTTAAVTIPAGSSTAKTVNLLQGTLTTETFDTTEVGSTFKNSGYVLIEDYENIAEGTIDIDDSVETFYDVKESVSGAAPIGAMAFAGPTDAAYDIRYYNDGMRIYFGDDRFGKKPTGTITVKYVTTDGANVDYQTSGLVMAFESATVDDDDGPPNSYSYTLTSTSAITGGAAPETDADIKTWAPVYVKTADRAVIKDDYEYWMLQSGVGNIVDAEVYGQEEESTLEPYNMNNVYSVYLQADGADLTNAEKTSLRTYMDSYKTLTTHLVFMNAEQAPLQINITLQRNPNLSISDSEIYDIIKDEFDTLLAFEEGALGKDFYHSELVEHFHNLTTDDAGVTRKVATYVSIDVKVLKPFVAPKTTQAETITCVFGTTSDNYTISIDGTDYTYTQVGGDSTAADIASGLAAAVDAASEVDAVQSGDDVVITTATAGTSFTISNENSTVPANCPIYLDIQLPPSTLDNSDNEVLFEAGTIEMIQTDGTVLYVDSEAGHQTVDLTGVTAGSDATGLANDATAYTADITVDGAVNNVSVVGSAAQTYTNLIAEINADLTGATASLNADFDIVIQSDSTDGSVASIVIADTDLFSTLTHYSSILTDDNIGTFAGGTVDYTTGLIDDIPLPATASYYIRYQQDADMNVVANEQVALDYSLPKTNFTDVTELLSTIVINS